MKAHFTVEQFFNPRVRAQLGVALAFLRVAYAWAMVVTCLQIHTHMPEILTHVRVQAAPFLEVVATMWAISWWTGLLGGAAMMLALGVGTRIAAGVFLLFLGGVALLDVNIAATAFGAWGMVGVFLLATTFFSRWGMVFGVDDVLDRLGVLRRSGKRGSMMW